MAEPLVLILFIVGILSLIVGASFFWLNNNSPIQTSIPAFTLPVGAVCLLLAIGKMLP